ncbi:MAG TPA: 3-phosphoshikimate 1-carboxyvinyltransferase [Pyrinomonadaceae bacterium]|nr:3-phosphoshikimate 1-carboxyvinyltransferase [Pyrinomonadaceae bacterium]
MLIRPAKALRGKISLPGDKSISHRAAMLSAVAHGETRIENFASSADCASTVKCLESLGVSIKRDGSTLTVNGVGKTGFRASEIPLDCGNSGTTMRLLSGLLAGQSFESVLVGDESLQKRPMRRVADPLNAMGATVELTAGHAPVKIAGRNPLKDVEYQLPVASAQIKSCVLLAGLNSDGVTAVIEPTPTRDHTERMLRWFGVQVGEEETSEGKRISVSGDSELTARDLKVPSDISSAAFFLAAAAGLPGSEIEIGNVGLNPSRTAIVDVLRGLAVRLEVLDRRDISNEPVGTIRVRGGLGTGHGTTPNRVAGRVIANLIDEIPILAVFGTRVQGGIEIRDAAELRHKESDRIAAVAENLRRMGAAVEEFPDGLHVRESKLKGATVDSFGDHRIAMAFAIAGLFAEGETEIIGAESAAVSFPEFFDVLGSVTEE